MNFHGGDVYRYPDKQLLDFSSNINPLGVPESFKRALLENIDDFTRYPDLEYTQLKSAIARYLGWTQTDCIVPGNGAVELIYKTLDAVSCKHVVTLSPTFSEYARAARQRKLPVKEIVAFNSAFSTLDLDLLISQTPQYSLVIICNPNNPTGSLLSTNELSYLAEQLAKMDSTLLIDEAFIEFTDNYPLSSMTDKLNKHPNLIIIRAMTKFFGMPGIRLGYALTANPLTATRITEELEPWNINASAVIAGCTVLDDIDYIQCSRAWLVSERTYLYEHLRAIEGLKVYNSQANFHLTRLESTRMDAWQLKKELVERGILIRTPDGFNNLSPNHFRLAVKGRTANDALIHALKAVLPLKGDHE